MKRVRITAVILFMLLLSGNFVTGQDLQIINVEHRKALSLNGYWKFIVDPYQTGYFDYRQMPRDEQENPSKAEALFLGHKQQYPYERVEYDFDKAGNMMVPGDWNSQYEKLYYYEGAVWYYKSFDLKPEEGKRQFLYFGAANYRAEVYLNGEKLGTHIGGFTPFNFEITGKIKPEGNFVIVMVDNTRKKDAVPTVNTDWWNYGGLTRDVKIVEVSETFVQDYYIQLAPGNKNQIDVSVTLNGANKANQTVVVEIPEAKIKTTVTTNAAGIGVAKVKAEKLKLWHPENAFLYDVNIVYQDEVLSDRIGFRTLKTQGTEILVNDQPVFLRGICIHEENPMRRGRAYSREDAQLLLGWAKELGCNFVRLAHYTHNENMIRVADEMGLMVWSEVPVYWAIQWENESVFQNASNQLFEMITRDKNRASVIIWSMANETPVSPARTTFLKRMIDNTRKLDPVRLVSAALETHTKPGMEDTRIIEDPLQEFVDVISFNQYIGWYAGLPENCATAVFEIEFDKPVIISEFGGGALQGYHGTKEDRWTEEFQEHLFDETIKMIDKIPQLRGVTPWLLADFKSPRRLLADIQDEWNRKGVISDNGQRKKAFYILRDYYEKKQIQFSR